MEDFNKALRDYDKAVELFRENPELWYAKADAEYNLGRIPESIQSYKTVLALNPDNRQASLDLANTYIDIEKYEDADVLLCALIESSPEWAEPYYSKSKMSFLQAEIELGIKYIEMAFTINPQDRFDYEFEADWEKVLQFLISRDA